MIEQQVLLDIKVSSKLLNLKNLQKQLSSDSCRSESMFPLSGVSVGEVLSHLVKI